MNVISSWFQGVPTPVLEVGHYGNSATINCTFLDGSSHYCVVCCSSDPSVPAGSVGYLSSTSGPSVSVSLQSLGSNQMYYCKAAATNTTSASCGGPVVGGVKVFFSFMIRPHTELSEATPTTPGKILHVVLLLYHTAFPMYRQCSAFWYGSSWYTSGAGGCGHSSHCPNVTMTKFHLCVSH